MESELTLSPSTLGPFLGKLPTGLLNQILNGFNIETLARLRRVCRVLNAYITKENSLWEPRLASSVSRLSIAKSYPISTALIGFLSISDRTCREAKSALSDLIPNGAKGCTLSGRISAEGDWMVIPAKEEGGGPSLYAICQHTFRRVALTPTAGDKATRPWTFILPHAIVAVYTAGNCNTHIDLWKTSDVRDAISQSGVSLKPNDTRQIESKDHEYCQLFDACMTKKGLLTIALNTGPHYTKSSMVYSCTISPQLGEPRLQCRSLDPIVAIAASDALLVVGNYDAETESPFLWTHFYLTNDPKPLKTEVSNIENRKPTMQITMLESTVAVSYCNSCLKIYEFTAPNTLTCTRSHFYSALRGDILLSFVGTNLYANDFWSKKADALSPEPSTLCGFWCLSKEDDDMIAYRVAQFVTENKPNAFKGRSERQSLLINNEWWFIKDDTIYKVQIGAPRSLEKKKNPMTSGSQIMQSSKL